MRSHAPATRATRGFASIPPLSTEADGSAVRTNRSSAHRPGVRKCPLIRLRFRTRQSRRLRTQETPRQLRLLPPSSSTSICSPRSSSFAASRADDSRAQPLQALVLRRQCRQTTFDQRVLLDGVIPALTAAIRDQLQRCRVAAASAGSAPTCARILGSRCGLRLLPARSASARAARARCSRASAMRARKRGTS